MSSSLQMAEHFTKRFYGTQPLVLGLGDLASAASDRPLLPWAHFQHWSLCAFVNSAIVTLGNSKSFGRESQAIGLNTTLTFVS